jgi:glycosyltransferase involved in cell wall biosynthesis
MPERKLHVLFVQNEIPHYRVPFFAGLAATSNIDLVVSISKVSRLRRYPGSLTLKELDKESFAAREERVFLRRFRLSTILYILRARPDVVIVGGSLLFLGSWCVDSLMFLLLKALTGLRIVYGSSTSEYANLKGFRKLLRVAATKWRFVYCDSFVTYGEAARSILMRKGIPDNRIFVAFNSLDTDKLAAIKRELENQGTSWKQELSQRLGINDYSKVILFLGRIRPEKKLDLLLRAFPLIKKREHNAILLIVGDSAREEWRLSLVGTHPNRDCIVFAAPTFDDREVAQYFLLSHVAVFPGWISLATQFAMCMGVPVVCAPAGNEKEYIRDGQNGYFFKTDDPIDLADKVSLALKNRLERAGEVSAALLREQYNLRSKIQGHLQAVYLAVAI